MTLLLENIQNDLKVAMKSKNEKELSAIRMLVAAIKNEEINKRPKTLEEADVAAVIKREIKKLKDAVEQFTAPHGGELAAQYEEEIIFLGKYLPEEIGEDEVRRIVKSVAEKAIDRNFGAMMKAVMAELKGKADGSLVSKVVKEELSPK